MCHWPVLLLALEAAGSRRLAERLLLRNRFAERRYCARGTGLLIPSPYYELMIYDPPTNTFAIRTPEGAPATFFRPKGDGMAYWEKQLAIDGGKRTP